MIVRPTRVCPCERVLGRGAWAWVESVRTDGLPVHVAAGPRSGGARASGPAGCVTRPRRARRRRGRGRRGPSRRGCASRSTLDFDAAVEDEGVLVELDEARGEDRAHERPERRAQRLLAAGEGVPHLARQALGAERLGPGHAVRVQEERRAPARDELGDTVQRVRVLECALQLGVEDRVNVAGSAAAGVSDGLLAFSVGPASAVGDQLRVVLAQQPADDLAERVELVVGGVGQRSADVVSEAEVAGGRLGAGDALGGAAPAVLLGGVAQLRGSGTATAPGASSCTPRSILRNLEGWYGSATRSCPRPASPRSRRARPTRCTCTASVPCRRPCSGLRARGGRRSLAHRVNAYPHRLAIPTRWHDDNDVLRARQQRRVLRVLRHRESRI